MDTTLYIVATVICFLISFSNFEDERKKEFSQVVAWSMLVAVFIPPAFDDKSIHLASIAYNFVIFTLLINTRCVAYMSLCYLYAISIINELMMYGSLVWFGDTFFAVGVTISELLIVAMVLGLGMGSGGYGGLIRYIRGGWRHNTGRNNNNTHERRV